MLIVVRRGRVHWSDWADWADAPLTLCGFQRLRSEMREGTWAEVTCRLCARGRR